MTINVDSINDHPVATDDYATTNEDTPVNISVLPNDSDADGDTLTLEPSLESDPSNGAVTLNADNVTFDYTPNPDFVGLDSFVYTISDGEGGRDTATGTLCIA